MARITREDLEQELASLREWRKDPQNSDPWDTDHEITGILFRMAHLQEGIHHEFYPDRP